MDEPLFGAPTKATARNNKITYCMQQGSEGPPLLTLEGSPSIALHLTIHRESISKPTKGPLRAR